MHQSSFFALYIPLFAAVAGKEQYLPVLRYLGEIVERIAHARIVKVDERVIEHDRAGILSAEEHIAQREPQRQIQLIGCPPAEEGALMEHRFPGAADKRIQLAIEREFRIRSAGQRESTDAALFASAGENSERISSSASASSSSAAVSASSSNSTRSCSASSSRRRVFQTRGSPSVSSRPRRRAVSSRRSCSFFSFSDIWRSGAASPPRIAVSS